MIYQFIGAISWGCEVHPNENYGCEMQSMAAKARSFLATDGHR
jgi:hypothetical protein